MTLIRECWEAVRTNPTIGRRLIGFVRTLTCALQDRFERIGRRKI